ncbi:MAG: YraN family protein [Neisseria sp.]|nr:YraN family protein [Neisseria sp.]
MRLNHADAQAAEEAACKYLRGQGFGIIERNWHCPYGEIDIVARKKQLLIFVEVKYRRSAAFGGVIHSITAAKKNKMQRSILAYLQQHPHRGDVRADAVLLQAGQALRHIENILD